jgi:bacillopeptidase F
VKHDGVDQDCNGFDLTIEITAAEYSASRGKLSVQATSALADGAALEVVGYGAMRWDRKKQVWKFSASGISVNPGTVTVSGIEGSETTTITESGNEKPPGGKKK